MPQRRGVSFSWRHRRRVGDDDLEAPNLAVRVQREKIVSTHRRREHRGRARPFRPQQAFVEIDAVERQLQIGERVPPLIAKALANRGRSGMRLWLARKASHRR